MGRMDMKQEIRINRMGRMDMKQEIRINRMGRMDMKQETGLAFLSYLWSLLYSILGRPKLISRPTSIPVALR